MRADLKELLERVEKAEGPDRELDVLIAQAIAKPTTMLNGLTFDGAVAAYPNDLAGIAQNWPVPTYTASLDAALALVERVLPGWKKAFSHRSFQYDGWLVTLVPVSGDAQQGRSESAALALLAAMLNALLSQREASHA